MVTSGKSYPLYLIKFYDHCQTTGDNLNVIECEVVGYLIKEDNIAYYIASWVCDSTVNQSNTEVFGILKSTIIKKKKLK